MGHSSIHRANTLKNTVSQVTQLSAKTRIPTSIIIILVVLIKIALVSCCYCLCCRKKQSSNTGVVFRNATINEDGKPDTSFNANPSYVGANSAQTLSSETPRYPAGNPAQDNQGIPAYPPVYPVQTNSVNPTYPAYNPTFSHPGINSVYPAITTMQNDITASTNPVVNPTQSISSDNPATLNATSNTYPAGYPTQGSPGIPDYPPVYPAQTNPIYPA